jgi:ABC-2 type transport system ATP-binding protein
MSLRLARIAKSFGSTRALRGIDLELGAGVTGLLGPNGAGKTTLLRIAATAIAPDHGEILIRGRNPHSGHSEMVQARRELGYLPQDLGYPRDMTVFGFVEYIAVLKEWNERAARHAEVHRALELVDLADVAGKKIAKLSGGQRRRLGLAQALLGDPALLVLDEPTVGLDPTQRASLRRTLSKVAERSTVLLSTHQTEDVAALCERVIVLSDGEVLFDGSVVELVGTAAGMVWLCDEPGSGGALSWRTGTGRHRVIGGERPDGGEITEPTLEDAYLLMLGDVAQVDYAL